MSTYPRRESHFAHKFTRLMSKCCAAQEIGPEACWLVTVIAHQEDAIRYARPVTFFNGQLMPICGFESEGRLIRARARAVESGWLHYEPGKKRQPGIYWATIPPHAVGYTDSPIEEGTQIPLQNGSEIDFPLQNGSANEGKTKGNRRENDSPSTLALNPTPNTHTPDGDCVSRKASREQEYPEQFNQFWQVFPALRKSGKRKAFKAWQAATKRAAPATIITAATEYAASPAGLSQFAKGPEPWLNGDCWDDDRAAWQRGDSPAAPPTPTGPSVDDLYPPFKTQALKKAPPPKPAGPTVDDLYPDWSKQPLKRPQQ